jgi:hypothetical protein
LVSSFAIFSSLVNGQMLSFEANGQVGCPSRASPAEYGGDLMLPSRAVRSVTLRL